MRLLLHERRQTNNLSDNAQLIQFPFLSITINDTEKNSFRILSIFGGLVSNYLHLLYRKEGCAFYQANKYLSLILKNVWHRERGKLSGINLCKKS